MKILRLLITKDCNRKCHKCCNKQYNLDKLETVQNFDFDQILLTGGEPMLDPSYIIELCQLIRKTNSRAPIILYTAKLPVTRNECCVLNYIDGLTLTLHNQNDAEKLRQFENKYKKYACNLSLKSLRLNVFKGISLPKLIFNWKVKKNMVWIDNCPLPENEVFMKLLK